MIRKSQAKSNVKNTRKDKDSHFQARRVDDEVEEDQLWASEIKKKQEEQNTSSKNNNGAL
jgi:hypothetical protein